MKKVLSMSLEVLYFLKYVIERDYKELTMIARRSENRTIKIWCSDIFQNKGTRAFQYFCLQVRHDACSE